MKRPDCTTQLALLSDLERAVDNPEDYNGLVVPR